MFASAGVLTEDGSEPEPALSLNTEGQTWAFETAANLISEGVPRSCKCHSRAEFFEADLMAMVPRAPDGISRSVWGGEPKTLKGCIFLSFHRGTG